jgi:hypothetical protein
MNWVEIIKLRTIEHDTQNLTRDLIRPMIEHTKENGLTGIEIYHGARLETDVSIHLLWNTKSPESYRTTIGMRLFMALEAYGLAYHSAWIKL